MFYPGFGVGFPAGSFEQSYHIYPVSFIDKPHLENGDKIILPPSALDRLASLHIDYPMLFELHNDVVGRSTHCGVLEFVADEGMAYMPYWMMQNLLLQEGDIVRIKSATLQKGSYVKLQPHTTDFLDISNPKAVLETTLRNFSCLTTGDNIMVAYNNKKYYIDIVETRPAAAITIIETDCEVDFAPPLDYKEPERQPRGAAGAAAAPVPAVAAGGAGGDGGSTGAEEEANGPKFLAFTGSGRRLDGRASRLAPPAASAAASTASTTQSAGANNSAARSTAAGTGSNPSTSASNAATSSAARGGRAAGKLVFGGPRAGSSSRAQQGGSSSGDGGGAGESKGKGEANEEPKFKSFSGKAYSLR